MTSFSSSLSVAAASAVSTVDVCVVGGGAIGKTAALALAGSGLRIALVDASSSAVSNDAWDTRVYALNHEARALLSSLRVWEAMDASRIATVDSMVVEGADAGSGQAGRIAFDAYAARTDALAWIVEDRNLNQALDAALRFAPQVQVVRARAAALHWQGERVVLRLDGGTTIAASLLVGADGAQSWVRGRCDIDVGTRSYQQQAVVANFACEKPHHGTAHQWFTASEGVVALLPLPGERVSLVWSAPQALAESLVGGLAESLAARVTDIAGDTLGRLSPLPGQSERDLRSFPLSLLQARSVVAPRVALVGDAAHVIHPLAGQGMNLGFGDVAALVNALRERGAQRDCGDARVLAAYARSRKEAVLLMQAVTDGLERLFGFDNEFVRTARNLGMNLLDRLPFAKRRLMAQALGAGRRPD